VWFDGGGGADWFTVGVGGDGVLLSMVAVVVAVAVMMDVMMDVDSWGEGASEARPAHEQAGGSGVGEGERPGVFRTASGSLRKKWNALGKNAIINTIRKIEVFAAVGWKGIDMDCFHYCLVNQWNTLSRWSIREAANT
jgi:hypothetical protein